MHKTALYLLKKTQYSLLFTLILNKMSSTAKKDYSTKFIA